MKTEFLRRALVLLIGLTLALATLPSADAASGKEQRKGKVAGQKSAPAAKREVKDEHKQDSERIQFNTKGRYNPDSLNAFYPDLVL